MITTSPDKISSWDEVAIRRKEQVCRISLGGNATYGSGLLIAPNLVLTNYHVIEHAVTDDGKLDEPDNFTIKFYTFGSRPQPAERQCYLAKIKPLVSYSKHTAYEDHPEYGKWDKLGRSDDGEFSLLEHLDYAVLKLRGYPPGFDFLPTRMRFRGWINLFTQLQVVHREENKSVQHISIPVGIIHFPKGIDHPKTSEKTSLVKDIKVDLSRVRYGDLNTSPGSSGAPILATQNPRGRLVALHNGTDPKGVPIPSKFPRGIPALTIRKDLWKSSIRGQLVVINSAISIQIRFLVSVLIFSFIASYIGFAPQECASSNSGTIRVIIVDTPVYRSSDQNIVLDNRGLRGFRAFSQDVYETLSNSEEDQQAGFVVGCHPRQTRLPRNTNPENLNNNLTTLLDQNNAQIAVYFEPDRVEGEFTYVNLVFYYHPEWQIKSLDILPLQGNLPLDTELSYASYDHDDLSEQFLDDVGLLISVVKGIIDYERGEYIKAIEHFNEIDEAPESLTTSVFLGNSYLLTGNRSEALHYYQQGIELECTSSECQLMYIRTLTGAANVLLSQANVLRECGINDTSAEIDSQEGCSDLYTLSPGEYQTVDELLQDAVFYLDIATDRLTQEEPSANDTIVIATDMKVRYAIGRAHYLSDEWTLALENWSSFISFYEEIDDPVLLDELQVVAANTYIFYAEILSSQPIPEDTDLFEVAETAINSYLRGLQLLYGLEGNASIVLRQNACDGIEAIRDFVNVSENILDDGRYSSLCTQ
ncbi:MAG: hypothetical protein AAF846_29510 [Chloroflexota bacterium]